MSVHWGVKRTLRLRGSTSENDPTETCRESYCLLSSTSFKGCSWGEIDLAQDSRDELGILYQMDRYPGGQFPYSAFFWPALVAASAAETASSITAHFMGFSGDADGDHTAQE